jgi:signal transduction histidine kinase
MLNLHDYSFEHGAMSIVQMGEELIGHPSTALLELIKNGYDADATECKVYINYDGEIEKTFLIIQDNGLGMDDETLFGNWLNPSASRKRVGDKKSKIFERNYLGSKGIGRLAAMALGKNLTVISKQYNEDKYNFIVLDRDIFKTDQLLKDVKFKGGKTSNVEDIITDKNIHEWRGTVSNPLILDKINESFVPRFKEGTIIIIEFLDNSITSVIEEEFSDIDINADQTSLVRALRIFITPLELNKEIQSKLVSKKLLDRKYKISKDDSLFNLSFGINLIKDKDDKIEFIPIKSIAITDYFNYRVYGKVRKNGEVKGFFDVKRLKEDTYEEAFNIDGQSVLSDEQIKERKRKIEEIGENLTEATGVGEFIFDIRIYDRGETEIVDKISKLLKTEGRAETKKYLNDFLGLRISKNGFGVKPYGEERKDWMDLSKMRVQNPGSVINGDQILGYIYLYSPENDNLSEQTNREGFFESKTFNTFKKIMRAILIEAGRRRYLYRLKHGLGRNMRSQFERPDVDSFLGMIESKVKDKKIVKKSKQFVEQINTVLDNVEKSLNLSERLASIGSGLELVYHELAQPITQLGGVKYSLELKKKYFIDEKVKKYFIDDINSLTSSASTFNTLKESLKPAIGISLAKDFHPIETFRKVCFLFTKDINDYAVKILEDKALDKYIIKDHEYAIWIAFLNILNNAFYWLKYNDKSRTIKFTLEKKNIMVLSNNGPKIQESELERIFEYGVTFRKEKSATGLGLTYTKNILKRNDWEIWAENRKDGPAFLIKKNKTK